MMMLYLGYQKNRGLYNERYHKLAPIFSFLGLYSGAMSMATTVIFIILAAGITNLAWIEEKKKNKEKMN